MNKECVKRGNMTILLPRLFADRGHATPHTHTHTHTNLHHFTDVTPLQQEYLHRDVVYYRRQNGVAVTACLIQFFCDSIGVLYTFVDRTEGVISTGGTRGNGVPIVTVFKHA